MMISILTMASDTAWTRLDATSSQQGSLRRILRGPMAHDKPSAFISPAEAYALDKETLPKFMELKVFWIKVSDFMDIVPRHPHLANIRFSTTDIALVEHPFGKPPASGDQGRQTPKEEAVGPFMNGNLTNGHR